MNLALAPAAAALLEPCAPRVSVSGLPAHVSEAELRALLSAFGRIRALTHRRQRGAAVVEFEEQAATEAAAAGLAAMSLGGRPLRVALQGPAQNARALRQLIAQQEAALAARLAGAPPPAPVPLAAASGATVGAVGQAPAPPQPPLPPDDDGDAQPPPLPADPPPPEPAPQQEAPPVTNGASGAGTGGDGCSEPPPPQPPPPPPRAVRLENVVVDRADLEDDAAYAELLAEVTSEVAKYGALERVVIPRPAAAQGGGGENDPPGAGLVFLVYDDARGAERARAALDGRRFGDATIAAALEDAARVPLAES